MRVVAGGGVGKIKLQALQDSVYAYTKCFMNQFLAHIEAQIKYV